MKCPTSIRSGARKCSRNAAQLVPQAHCHIAVEPLCMCGRCYVWAITSIWKACLVPGKGMFPDVLQRLCPSCDVYSIFFPRFVLERSVSPMITWTRCKKIKHCIMRKGATHLRKNAKSHVKCVISIKEKNSCTRSSCMKIPINCEDFSAAMKSCDQEDCGVLRNDAARLAAHTYLPCHGNSTGWEKSCSHRIPPAWAPHPASWLPIACRYGDKAGCGQAGEGMQSWAGRAAVTVFLRNRNSNSSFFCCFLP